MACCLTAPSHHLNQCWPIISEVLQHSPESNFTGNAPDIYHWYDFENDSFKFRAASPRGQWVNAMTNIGQDQFWIPFLVMTTLMLSATGLGSKKVPIFPLGSVLELYRKNDSLVFVFDKKCCIFIHGKGIFNHNPVTGMGINNPTFSLVINSRVPLGDVAIFSDILFSSILSTIEINNNKHVYHQIPAGKPIGSEVKWTGCSLIIGTGCWVQGF